MDRRSALRTLLALAGAALLPPPAAAGDRRLRVGVLPGPDASVMEVVRDVAAARGLALELVPGGDPARMNAAVASGALDANAGQDAPSLEADLAAHPRALAAVATTITLPLCVYSRRVRSLRELRPGDTVAISAEPREAARALLLLHNYGLVLLREGAGLRARLSDVAANPRKVRLVATAPRELPGALARATAAALAHPLAAAAGLEPARDAIAMEDARSPWAHVLVTRARDASRPWVAALVAACHSEAVRDFILAEYRDSVRRAW